LLTFHLSLALCTAATPLGNTVALRPLLLTHLDNTGQSPVFLASECGFLDVVRYLVEAGVKSDKRAKDGRTPLFAAAEKGFLDVVLFLMQSNNEKTAKLMMSNKKKREEEEAAEFLRVSISP
jgi:ankyrin repeat protein